MFYIKLGTDMTLTVTVREPIYRGDNLSTKIIYLVPKTINEIDMASASLYLSYIRADGVADVVILERSEALYKNEHYQYVLPVTCKLSKFPGQVVTWIQVYTGDVQFPTISKSSECVLYIEDSKNMDDYLCDHQVTALYQMQKRIDDDMAEMGEVVAKKADGLSYNDETRELRLKSGDNTVGDVVVVPSDSYDDDIKEEVEDTWSDMTETDVGEQNASWEEM